MPRVISRRIVEVLFGAERGLLIETEGYSRRSRVESVVVGTSWVALVGKDGLDFVV